MSLGIFLPLRLAESADVCLIVEGAYPYVAGGVSSWIDGLIRRQPSTRFSVVAILPEAPAPVAKYKFPPNLVSLHHLFLGQSQSGIGHIRMRPRDRKSLLDCVDAFLRNGDVDVLAELNRLLAPHLRGRRPASLLNSSLAWDLVTDLYERTMPQESFLHFFWAWRSLFGGLVATLEFPLPEARIYHTVSTGYAGVLAARAAVETGRPALITEHGIYTNERRIEILQANWIVDTIDKGFAIHDPRRDLRDFWTLAFESFARACYAACAEVITLHEDNQSAQVAAGADPRRVRIIPNGVDYAKLSRLPQAGPDDPPTVALVGRVVPIKDIKTFLQAVHLLRRQIPDVRALILGPVDEQADYAEECLAMVAELDLAGTVEFAGRVDVADYFPRIHVNVLTSLSESQPLVLLEAGARAFPASRPMSAAAARFCSGGAARTRPLARAAPSQTSHRRMKRRARLPPCSAIPNEESRRAASSRSASGSTMTSASSTRPMPMSIKATGVDRSGLGRGVKVMAGIGFSLDRLYRSESIADRMAAFAHASIVTAGPCLFSVLCIWLIGVFNSEMEGHSTIAEFRVLVIYSFGLSFVVTSPIAPLSARPLSDRLYERDVGAVSGLMLAAFGFTALSIILASALIYGFLLDLEPAVVVAAIATSALVAFLWIGGLFCSATRDYVAVTAAFAAGTFISFATVSVSYAISPTLETMLWGFDVGLAVALFGLLSRIFATFPFAVRDLATPARALLRGLVAYWPIALGGLFAGIGAWVDKWVVWLSPQGKQIGYGLLHAPLYDSAMFIAYLVAIPAYAAFVIRLEVSFFRNYRRFYDSILDHATLAQIRGHGARLREETIASLTSIMTPQLVIAALFAALAPVVIALLDMQFRQVGTLRFGVIGAVLQFLFITCSSLTLYFDRRYVFLALQVCTPCSMPR